MNKIYNILEVANTHGGNVDYVMDLVEEFKEFHKEEGFGIKFQPFKYNQIALEDFEWYGVYKELYFNENEWLMISPSGTEPVLRCYAESHTVDDAKKILANCKKEIGIS